MRLCDIHFQIVIPVYVAMSLFDELHHDLFADDGTFDSHSLLAGFDNKTLELGRALWDLSRTAAADAGVRQIIEAHAASEVAAALEGSAGGRQFLNEMDRFLDQYGQRGSMWGICHRSWIEDPGPVINNLKDYLGQDRDPAAELQGRADEREAAVNSARERLSGYPANVRDQFQGLLKAASAAVVLTEDHGFWIDFNGTYRIRCAIVELGHRLAADGVIETGDDIFHLQMEEISAAGKASPAPDHSALVAERKKQLAHFGAVSPPLRMGTDYGPPPPGLVSMAFGKFFGLPPKPSDEADTLHGNAGSPGKVQGTARVIRSLDEADKLGLGDILVCETTAPPWTPLFATAGAIVTDTGGILSHCAVVAREYRIPAVVGTGMATAVIRDGQTVEVDGDSGLVRIVSA